MNNGWQCIPRYRSRNRECTLLEFNASSWYDKRRTRGWLETLAVSRIGDGLNHVTDIDWTLLLTNKLSTLANRHALCQPSIAACSLSKLDSSSTTICVADFSEFDADGSKSRRLCVITHNDTTSSRPLKNFTYFCTDRNPVCDFVLVNNTNLYLHCHRFWVIPVY